MNLDVRTAEVDDVPGIVHAYLGSWRAGYEGLLPQDVIEEQVNLRRAHDWIGAIGWEGWRVDEQMPPAHSGFFPLIYYRRDLLNRRT